MKNSYTTIYYKDQKISGIFAATLENDFYDEVLLGATNIIEEEAPSRDIPYFYGISRSPLEFEVIFAFEEPLDIYEIKKYIEMFYSNETYQSLAFEREDGFITPIYYVLVTGEPELEYIRTETNKYVGYFKLTFRANAPYGFTEGSYLITSSEDMPVENFNLTEADNHGGSINLSSGSLHTTQYLITLTKADKKLENGTPKTAAGNIEIEIGGKSFKFEDINPSEVVVIDGRNKRIYAKEKIKNEEGDGFTLKDSEKSIYIRWTNRNEGFPPLVNGINNIYLRGHIRAEITYRMPRYI